MQGLLSGGTKAVRIRHGHLRSSHTTVLRRLQLHMREKCHKGQEEGVTGKRGRGIGAHATVFCDLKSSDS